MPTDERNSRGSSTEGTGSDDAAGVAVPPAAANEGNLVASPGLAPDGAAGSGANGDGAAASRADARAAGQLLTGRAARSLPAAAAAVSLSPMQLAWRKLRKNRLAVTGGVVLLVLYTMALFAPFLAPYDYISQKGEAYQPPMRVYLTPWPTAYVSTQTFNEYRERVFTEDPNRPLPLRFFVRGEPYKLLWLIPTNVHLFGVEGEKRIHLLGTDGAG